jgi:hypothetical protein
MSEDKTEKIKRIYAEMKQLHRRMASLNQQLTAVENDLPEPMRFDDDFIPEFLRKKNEPTYN